MIPITTSKGFPLEDLLKNTWHIRGQSINYAFPTQLLRMRWHKAQTNTPLDPTDPISVYSKENCGESIEKQENSSRKEKKKVLPRRWKPIPKVYFISRVSIHKSSHQAHISFTISSKQHQNHTQKNRLLINSLYHTQSMYNWGRRNAPRPLFFYKKNTLTVHELPSLNTNIRWLAARSSTTY